jgi:Domain of unknown function (DUF4406)
MRGYAEYNFPAFARATRLWRDYGYEVISPAEHDLQSGFDPEKSLEENAFDTQAALLWDIQQIIDPDTEALYMLTDWEASFGANTEHSVAVGIGKAVFYESPKDEAKYVYRPYGAFAR